LLRSEGCPAHWLFCARLRGEWLARDWRAQEHTGCKAEFVASRATICDRTATSPTASSRSRSSEPTRFGIGSKRGSATRPRGCPGRSGRNRAPHSQHLREKLLRELNIRRP
jgi:hypothetical protein